MALALRTTAACGREALAGRWLVKEQRHLREQLRLIELDDEELVPLGLPDLRTQRVLAIERIPGHQAVPQGELPQQVRSEAQFCPCLLLSQLVFTCRRRGHGFGPHPPFAPAPGQS